MRAWAGASCGRERSEKHAICDLWRVPRPRHRCGAGGVPAGLELDLERVSDEMARRAPGKSPSTARKEADVPEILSGLFEGRTTGTPLCAVIANTDTRSRDYAKLKDLPRPGHGDYAGYVRYQGCNDYRGGGHFSGRLTAPLVFCRGGGQAAAGAEGSPGGRPHLQRGGHPGPHAGAV